MPVFSRLVILHPRQSKNAIHFLPVEVLGFALDAAKSELEGFFLVLGIVADVDLVLNYESFVDATFEIAIVKLAHISTNALAVLIAAV